MNALRRVSIKKPKQIEIMRRAGGLVAETFRVLEPHVVAGATLRDLDRIAESRGNGQVLPFAHWPESEDVPVQSA